MSPVNVILCSTFVSFLARLEPRRSDAIWLVHHPSRSSRPLCLTVAPVQAQSCTPHLLRGGGRTRTHGLLELVWKIVCLDTTTVLIAPDCWRLVVVATRARMVFFALTYTDAVYHSESAKKASFVQSLHRFDSACQRGTRTDQGTCAHLLDFVGRHLGACPVADRWWRQQPGTAAGTIIFLFLADL